MAFLSGGRNSPQTVAGTLLNTNKEYAVVVIM